MTPRASSPSEPAPDSKPLDFYHWLAARGMNPNRKRPLGRTAALLMDYRAYLERQVGKENVNTWFEKYARKIEAPVVGTTKTG